MSRISPDTSDEEITVCVEDSPPPSVSAQQNTINDDTVFQVPLPVRQKRSEPQRQLYSHVASSGIRHQTHRASPSSTVTSGEYERQLLQQQQFAHQYAQQVQLAQANLPHTAISPEQFGLLIQQQQLAQQPQLARQQQLAHQQLLNQQQQEYERQKRDYEKQQAIAKQKAAELQEAQKRAALQRQFEKETITQISKPRDREEYITRGQLLSQQLDQSFNQIQQAELRELSQSIKKSHISEQQTKNERGLLNLESPKNSTESPLLSMFSIRTPCASSDVKIGIIGGTGLDQDATIIKDKQYVNVDMTPFGRASDDQVVVGRISKTDVVLIARHGKNHSINPSNVNYRANLYALKNQFKCHIVLSTTACGSLKKQLEPGCLVVLDQYIDRTIRGNQSIFKCVHMPQGDPFDSDVRKCMIQALEKIGYKHETTGTAVTIEGPRYSTKAESKMFQSWGADVVNMTTVPECSIASELALHYASLALVTDYDCWHEDPEEEVNVKLVTERLVSLREKAHNVLFETIKIIETVDWQIPHTRKMRISSHATMEKSLNV